MEKIPRPEIPVRLDRADGNQIKDVMTNLGKAMATQDKYFVKNFEVVKVVIDHDGEVVTRPPSSQEVINDLEEFVYPYKEIKPKLTAEQKKANKTALETGGTPPHDDKPIQVYSEINDTFANKILGSERFMDKLPHIRATFRCPMLIERPDGSLDEIHNYDRASGIWCQGKKTERMEVSEAIEVINEILEDFRFLEDGDRARAIASLFSPAMHYSGLTKGRTPFDVTEADASQSGKGFRNQIISTLYNTRMGIVNWGTGKKGITDNPVESFFNYMYEGWPFICLDNVRGKLEEQTLESFATENTIRARILQKAKIMDPRDFCVFATSNSAQMNRDMVNRSSIVRIRKREDNNFRKYGPDTNDNILKAIREDRPHFLGAIFTIIKDWHSNGAKSLKCDHNMNTFNAWFEKMNFIVQHYWGLCDITNGMGDIQKRVISRNLSTCRALANAINQAGKLGDWLQAGDLESILLDDEDGKVAIGINPNVEELNKAIGRRLANVFRGQPDGVVWFQVSEGYVIRRLHKAGDHKENIPSENYYMALRAEDHQPYDNDRELPVGQAPKVSYDVNDSNDSAQMLLDEMFKVDDSDLDF